MITSSTKTLYEVSGGKIDTHLKIHEKWKRDFPESIFDLNEWQESYGMAFLASKETKVIHLRGEIVATPECHFCGATDNLVHFSPPVQLYTNF